MYSRQKQRCYQILLTNIFIVFNLLLQLIESTCTKEQISSCRHAAYDNKLEALPSGGQCIEKQYVQYTHLCTVTNYFPNIDYCCCAYESRLYCCRYHHFWYHFRCVETEDVIDTLSTRIPPLEILLPSTLIPLATIICCVICCWKCLCYKYDENMDTKCALCTCPENSNDHSEKWPGGLLNEDSDRRFQRVEPSAPSWSLSASQDDVKSMRTLASTNHTNHPLPINGSASSYHQPDRCFSPDNGRCVNPAASGTKDLSCSHQSNFDSCCSNCQVRNQRDRVSSVDHQPTGSCATCKTCGCHVTNELRRCPPPSYDISQFHALAS